MQREEGKKLLELVKGLAEDDVFVEMHLKLATVEAKAELGSSDASQEFIDDVIINKYLLNMVSDLLSFQTKRSYLLQKELNKINNIVGDEDND